MLSYPTDRPWQTVPTQIRLPVKEHSDQGLHCLQFHLYSNKHVFLDNKSHVIRKPINAIMHYVTDQVRLQFVPQYDHLMTVASLSGWAV